MARHFTSSLFNIRKLKLNLKQNYGSSAYHSKVSFKETNHGKTFHPLIVAGTKTPKFDSVYHGVFNSVVSLLSD